MTPEELSSMTLANLEALAARMEGAARTIREAMAMLGTHPPTTPAPTQGGRGPVYFEPHSPPEAEDVPEHIRHEREERAAYLARMRQSPERQQALSQFRHDVPEEDSA